MAMRDSLRACRRYVRLRLSGVPAAILRTAGAGFDCGWGAFFRPGEDIRIGRRVFIGRYAHIAAPCQIGDDVMLASFVSFVGGDHRFDQPGVLLNSAGRAAARPIVVEQDAWIGHGSIILAGVTIGRGAIVAAGSVVTHDVPPCTIWGSSPARFLRDRFATEEEAQSHLQALDRQAAARFPPRRR